MPGRPPLATIGCLMGLGRVPVQDALRKVLESVLAVETGIVWLVCLITRTGGALREEHHPSALIDI